MELSVWLVYQENILLGAFSSESLARASVKLSNSKLTEAEITALNVSVMGVPYYTMVTHL